VVLLLDYDEIKHQNRLWRHFGDVFKIISPKIGHQTGVTKISHLYTPLPFKNPVCALEMNYLKSSLNLKTEQNTFKDFFKL